MREPLKIDQELLEQVSEAARTSPRRRRNRNFHTDESMPCHRLLNAVEPDSYIRPHRHAHVDKDESIVVVRGRLGALFFADDGTITETVVLEPTGPVMGVDIPHGTYHSLVALESGTVFFEAKAGPYLALETAELAPWAPAEGDAQALSYHRSLAGRFVSDPSSGRSR